MFEFFHELTMKQIIFASCIIVYLLVVFIGHFWCGFCTKPHEKADDLEMCLIWWWPLFIPVIIVEMLTDFSKRVGRKFPKTSHKIHCVWKGIVTVVDYATLPLRPFTFGQRIANRNKKEKN